MTISTMKYIDKYVHSGNLLNSSVFVIVFKTMEIHQEL